MTKVSRIGLATLVALLSLGFYINQRLSSLDEAIGEATKKSTLIITRGMTFKQVVARLSHDKLIKDSMVFEWYARYIEADRSVKAGTYQLSSDWTPRILLEKLKKGTLPKAIRVTIPEGWNRWQIADRLRTAGVVDRSVFLRRVEMESLEGKLFPNTYYLNPSSDTNRVIQRLTTQFEVVWQSINQTRSPLVASLSAKQILNLAAMVEKEAGNFGDQQKVARVFINRLNRGMKFESDPTCVYRKDLYRQKPSPTTCRDKTNIYSTYIIKGLPPGPIGNPGKNALRAVLNPYEGPRADKLIFFVARRDGSKEHYFSENYEQHRKAIDRYLKKRAKR
jgi:UPF0755 protein